MGFEDERSALITGATGYIGSHLVKRLLADGWRVHIIIRSTSSCRLLDEYLPRLTTHIHDGSTDGMLEIMASAKPHVVYHLAAMSASGHQAADVEQMINSNVLFSTQILEAMYRVGIERFVNAESFWQHGDGSAEYSPTCLYAATKQAFHEILVYYADIGAINAISLILYDTYGADDPRKKLFPLLQKTAREGIRIDMTPGEQLVDYTHVDDVASAFVHASQLLQSPQYQGVHTYAVSSGSRMELRQLVDMIVRETGLPVQINWGGRPYRANEVMKPWPGEILPGWKPQVDLIAGIRDTFKGIG